MERLLRHHAQILINDPAVVIEKKAGWQAADLLRGSCGAADGEVEQSDQLTVDEYLSLVRAIGKGTTIFFPHRHDDHIQAAGLLFPVGGRLSNSVSSFTPL